LRRTAVIGTCIAAFTLLTSALNAPDVAPRTRKPVAAITAGSRALRQFSVAHPPISRKARLRTARALGLATVGLSPAPSVAPRSSRTRGQAVMPRPDRARPVEVRSEPVVHIVQSGDSLWTISRRHGVSVESVAAANDLRLTSILQLDQRLTIPADAAVVEARPAVAPARRVVATITHTVRSGETLWAIANRYGTNVEDVMALNEVGDSDWIKPGQRLLISGASLPRHRQTGAQAGPPRRPVMADARAIQASGTFLWPARGVLTSRFGWRYRRHHDGIDVASPTGSPIYAARDGVVEFSGWKGGYGRVVFVDHGAGVTTVYGHSSRLLVQAGQRVKKGQLIARVGCTGSCTGSHLHFEVRINGRAVDPLRHLGTAQARR
jgi:murein DD-endopeptidase MepM/ murein hydrolase activator NlpD